jgi:hypothetical protein
MEQVDGSRIGRSDPGSEQTAKHKDDQKEESERRERLTAYPNKRTLLR